MNRLSRVFRSLQAQLFLWAVLPVTFVIIALAFTGVYAHQRGMRDFVAERNLSLVRVTARIVADGVARGAVGDRAEGLSDWLTQFVTDQPEMISLVVVGDRGDVLWQLRPVSEPDDIGSVLSAAGLPLDMAQRREGSVIVPGGSGDRLLAAFAPVERANWSVIAWEPVEDMIGPILRFSSLAPVVALGAAALSLLILGFGWRTIVHPLRRLAQAAEQVSWGDFSAISEPVGGVQEIQNLHRALVDMTDRIQGYEAGMRDYLAAVTKGQEAERARLARELHDGPVQDLIALGQRAEMAERLVQRGAVGQAQALLGELRNAELATVNELRRLTGALRPVYLEDLGFIPALEMLVRQVAEGTAARVRLEKVCTDQRSTPESELAAYRIAQEALNNAVQHADAENIVIHVRCDADGIALAVEDDGAGFELPERPDVLTHAGRYGLLGMQERATLLGGRFHIDTSPGEGTRVSVSIPARHPAA